MGTHRLAIFARGGGGNAGPAAGGGDGRGGGAAKRGDSDTQPPSPFAPDAQLRARAPTLLRGRRGPASASGGTRSAGAGTRGGGGGGDG